jgi:sugar diacid utilization regulator
LSVEGLEASVDFVPWTAAPAPTPDAGSGRHRRYAHACALFWGPGDAGASRAVVPVAWRSRPEATVFVAPDEATANGVGHGLERAGLRGPLDVLPPPSGGDHQEARECLAAETQLLGARHDGVASADALCLHDLRALSGRKLLHLLRSHGRLVIGEQAVTVPPGAAEEVDGLGLVAHLTSILAIVDDRARLAELVTGLVDGARGPDAETGAVETVASLLGLCLDRLADGEALRCLAEERENLGRRLKRERSVTDLLGTLADRLADHDIEGILAEVSRVLGTGAALVSDGGAVLAGTVRAVPRHDRLRAAARNPFPATGDRAVADPVFPVRSSSGDVVAYLCLDDPPPTLDDVTVTALSAFLPAVAAVEIETRNRALRSVSVFLLSLLFAGDEFPDDDLGRWARSLGVDLATPHRVAFLTQSPSPGDWSPLEREQRVRNALGRLNEQTVLAATRDGLICLCPDPSSRPSSHWTTLWEQVLSEVAEVGYLGAALGGAFIGVAGVRRSYEQARSLAERQQIHGKVLAVPGVAVYESGGLAEIVLGHPDSENLWAYVHRVLGPLLAESRFGGELADTLGAYLATGGSPTNAAQLLHLHPSSVKYRMRIIRDILGARLEDHEQRFELELALRMLRTLKDVDGQAGTEGLARARAHR